MRLAGSSPSPRWRVSASGMNLRKVLPVSIFKKIAHKAEAVKGGAKKMAGRTVGSPRLKAEGRGDQVKGDSKMAGAKIKDAFKK